VTSHDVNGTSSGDPVLDQLVAEAKAKAARYQEMRAGVEQVTVTESSSDGLVTVTVDAGGVVTDLRLTDRIAEHSGAQVAAIMLATMRRAQARLGERVARIVQDTVGDDQAVLDKVTSSYHSRFPAPAPEEEPGGPRPPVEEMSIGTVEEEPRIPAPPPARPRPRAGEDGEDEDGGSVFEDGDE
jgi:DNA-binding protein YbaB